MPKLRALDFFNAAFARRYFDSDPSGSCDDVVVLLHGTFGSTASHFGLIFPELARDRRVIGLDLQVETDLQLSGLTDQVEALIGGLGLRTPHIIGYSLGAVVAAAYAGEHPNSVGQLVLLGGWARTDAHQKLRSDLWFRLRDSDEAALREFIALSVFGPEFLAGMTPAQLATTKNSVRLTDAGDAQMRLNRDIDIRDLAQSITAETLVLSCAQDAMVPPHHQRELSQLIEDSHVEFLPGGHGIVFENPDAVVAAINEFLD
ncbi:alpha/beta fold hydrolase [Corynebacterium kalinowskii]|nr:alpha/beta hydrolase [Corynebacterium kalinowskii]